MEHATTRKRVGTIGIGEYGENLLSGRLTKPNLSVYSLPDFVLNASTECS
jgi:hypothetical protein